MIDTNSDITFAGMVREKLHKNGFYTVDAVNWLVGSIMASSMSSYISSYSIDYEDKRIRLNLRQKYLNKFGDGQNDSFSFYDALEDSFKDLFSVYKSSVCSLLEPSGLLQFYSTPKKMFYALQRVENCLIIIL